jgi:SAM-dependent methyltransferase
MSKHDALTQEEFATFVPNENMMSRLHDFAQSTGRQPREIRALDWGCGRGRNVLWLRERGYEAYGVEIDPLPIQNGLPLFQSKGHPSECLALLDSNGRTPFPDGFFDYVFSGNVLEHVSDIGSVCAELARVTRPGGGGYHVFPAHRQPIENHLFMPLVHWLPAGRIRKLLIHIFVLMGREPKWVEVREAPAAQKTNFYYQYTVENTFYRPYQEVRKSFEENGLEVEFTTIDHPRIRANRFLARAQANGLLKRLLNHWLLTFKLVELETRKT